MPGTKLTTVEQQISPTVLSSDLFTPLREPRVTLPTIGTHSYDSAMHEPDPWGGSLTTYGGTGCETIQGTCRIRDLNQGRSHRHFGSGLSNHTTTAQPYRLTALKLSDCRINDQRLTTSPKTDPVSTKWQREAWPGHHPYFSHRSIFDVFPSGAFSEEKAPSESRTVVNPTSETTLAALRDVRHNLYQTTLYRDYFRAQDTDSSLQHESTEKPVIASDVCNTALYFGDDNMTVNREEEHAEEEKKEDSEDDEEIKPGEEYGNNRTSRCQTGEIKTVRVDDTVQDLLDKLLLGKTKRGQMKLMCESRLQSGSDLAKQAKTSSGSVSKQAPPTQNVPTPPPPQPMLRTLAHLTHLPPTRRSLKRPVTSLSIPNAPNLPNLKTVKDRSVEVNDSQQMLHKDNGTSHYNLTFALADRLSGIGPCWPPSTTQVIDKIRGTQLLERHELSGVPEAYYSTLQSRSQEPPSSSVYDNSTGVDELTERNPLEASYWTNGYRFMRCRDGSPFLLPDSFSTLSYKTPGECKDPRFIQKADGTALYLPPVPLSECLVPSGNDIPHKLGLRYKTEAQWRFHTMHPEVVPDLRSTRNFGKKYFFSDYHSSALRG